MSGSELRVVLKRRPADAHKGTFGKALLCAGSYGMAGAAVLSAKACLRSGVGLCYVHLPERCIDIMQISLPEAVISLSLDDLSKYNAIGCGPGLGMADDAVNNVNYILENYSGPLVLDADALNIISEKRWHDRIPRLSVLTPHPLEFARLTGVSGSRDEQVKAAKDFAAKYGVVMVLKGAGTVVASPDGDIYVNSTGNSGMATGGSGDVLTGMITGLMAQGYTPSDAARLGVYLHGVAGDIAAEIYGEHSLIASDIVDNIGKAMMSINNYVASESRSKVYFDYAERSK